MTSPDAPSGSGPKSRSAGAAAQRTPPQDISAEACVLGAMILHTPSIEVIVQITRAEHFYRPAHQLIYQALIDMREGGKPIDLVTVREDLVRRKQIDQVGGVDYLVALVEGVPTAANAEYYAMIVRDKAMLRELIVAATEIVQETYETREEATAVVDRAEERVFQIATEHIGNEAVTLKGLLQETFETLQEHDGRTVTGMPSGYQQLDELTSGFQRGEMIIIAARPSMGKTSILMNIAEYATVAEHVPVAFFSMEMSRSQLAQRLLASHAQFNLRQMRRGMISAEDWTKLQLAAGDLESAPMFIDDSPMLTALQLRAKARRLKAAHDIQCVFVDYLQLMTYSGRADSRQEQITEMSRAIKALARELEIPVICAAQLNRGPADRTTHRPRMSDLRESGSIEQDADVVSLLHSEDYYHRGETDYIPKNITEFIIAKQRNGPTGVVYLSFRPEFTRFEAAAPEAYQEAQAPF